MSLNPQGASSDRYSLIPRVLVFVRHSDRLLFLRGAPTRRIFPNLLNGVGGHVERGETPLSAARREVAEETGLCDLAGLSQRATITIDTGPQTPGVLLFVFLANATTTGTQSSPEGDLVWLTLPQALASDLVPDLYTLLPRLLNPATEPLFLHYSYDEQGELVVSEP